VVTDEIVVQFSIAGFPEQRKQAGHFRAGFRPQETIFQPGEDQPRARRNLANVIGMMGITA
jgi:hypothetical protein